MELRELTKHKLMKRTMKRIGYLFLAIAVFGAFSPANALESNEVAIWGTAGKHDLVVREFADYRWVRASDPQLLIYYCASKFAVGVETSNCLVGPASAADAKRFADALWSVWLGQTKKARSTFEQLSKNRDWSEWGRIGFLELAWHTEDIKALGGLLTSYESDQAKERSDAFNKALRRYRLLHAEATNDWERIHAVARQHSLHQITHELALFTAYGRALYFQGRKRELADLLQAAPPALQETTVYMWLKVDHALLRGGTTASMEVVKQYVASQAENEQFALQTAYMEILDSSQEVATAARASIHRLAEASKHNVRLLLEIAVTLISYDKVDDSAQVMALVDRKNTNTEEFAMFHTLAAWNEVYHGDINKAASRLNRALDMHPKQVGANYLRALIAKREGDREAGVVSLRNLFESDPYNENYVSLILHFRQGFQTTDLERLFASVLERKHFYGELMRQRLQESEKTWGENKVKGVEKRRPD